MNEIAWNFHQPTNAYFWNEETHDENYWHICNYYERQLPSINKWHNDTNKKSHHLIQKVAHLLRNSILYLIDISISIVKHHLIDGNLLNIHFRIQTQIIGRWSWICFSVCHANRYSVALTIQNIWFEYDLLEKLLPDWNNPHKLSQPIK